jgi:predicted protein tyrosine phosphatase
LDFFIYSRAAIERLPVHDVPHLIISITSAAEDVARVPEGPHTLELVRVSFLDVAEGQPGAMTEAHAASILAAFERHRGRLERVVLHCDAGVSRSPGVALALATLVGADSTEIRRRYAPNGHVVQTILRAAGVHEP